MSLQDGLSLRWSPVGSGARSVWSRNERERRTIKVQEILDVTMGSSVRLRSIRE